MNLGEKQMNLLDGLNSEQIKPILDTEGAVLVIAGAGSGKTRVLTSRIAHLVSELGISPYNILAITFTNKAANEMKERLSKMIDGSDSLWVSTIHGMCTRILRMGDNAKLLGYNRNFSIYSDTDKERVLKQIFEEKGISDNSILKNCKEIIGNCKSHGTTALEYYEEMKNTPDRLAGEVFLRYEEILKNSNAFDFDDLLNKTYELLKDFEEVRRSLSLRFKYIHVDEFQDTNRIQLKIIKMLSSENGNIFVVGDDDQSIYGWRGAEIENILNFDKYFKGAKLYKLEQNYRSTKKILSVANLIIQKNNMRQDKELWTENGDGVRVELNALDTETSEATYACQVIRSLVRVEGYKYSDIAILMRINALSRVYEQEFAKYNIPYRVYGGFKFYERKEIKDLTAYFRLINNPLDNDALLRVINLPKRGIGGKTIATLLERAKENNYTLFDALMDVEKFGFSQAVELKLTTFKNVIITLLKSAQVNDILQFARDVITLTGFMNMFATNSEEDLNRKANVNQFLALIEEYIELNPKATLSDFINSITLSSDIEDDGKPTNNEEVTLATIHSIKGLEFKAVIIAGLDESIFPTSRMMTLTEEEEERRLMYVAVTRARERLFLTRAWSRFLYGSRQSTSPSRFYKEVESYVKPKIEQPTRGVEERPKINSVFTRPIQQQSRPAQQNNLGGAKDYSEFRVGAKVSHVKFGVGTIVGVKGSGESMIADVAFAGLGIKSMSVQLAPMQIVKG